MYGSYWSHPRDCFSNPNKLDLNRIFPIVLTRVKRNSLPRKSKATIFLQALALKELSPFNNITLGTMLPTHKLLEVKVYELYWGPTLSLAMVGTSDPPASS